MSLITRTDVTAVKVHQEYILAGIGSWVNILSKCSGKVIQKLHALNGQKIYGFVPSTSSKVLVFGGKQFTLISKDGLRNDSLFSKAFEPVVCDDWLHSAVWLTEDTVALLTAHNIVQIWDTVNVSLITKHISKENSILYSGLLVPLQDDILVFSGTVFSEVLIHACGNDKPLHSLKGHKGVIFSVSCDLQKACIVTTSDDRSVRIWQLYNSTSSPNTIDYWKHVDIRCTHELYGHLARVMRNCIINDFVISIGEDSCICFWDYNGKLLRKVTTHQNACIWSLDADDEILVTGGGDAGVIVHPLSVVTQYGHTQVLDIEANNAKKVVFTARRNVVVMSDDDLKYYDVNSKSTSVYKLKHKSSYKLLSISLCRQILAVTDINGKLDVFAETCKGTASVQNIIDTQLQLGKILSMQWAGNRHLVLCSENGVITVLASKDDNIEVFANFVLPPCKERWFTAAAIDADKHLLVVGDRCGNIHVYLMGQKNPVNTFNKVHGRYGPTSITLQNNEIITTGRDGTIKYFNIDLTGDNRVAKLMMSKDMEFQWVEKFIDKNKHYICGFQERVFVVYDIRYNSKLFEISCGGGHRSWDIMRYFEKVDDVYEEFIQLMYIKASKIHFDTFQLSKVVSKSIINGTHAKEINCLKSFISNLDPSATFYITGGEDTTLRISSLKSEKEFRDEILFKQLSSIRALKLSVINDNTALLISAGGRAQICIKLIKFVKVNDKIKIVTEELVGYLIKGTDRERKGNQTWRNCSVDFDPETRIMDVDVVTIDNNNFIVLAGCSDAYLRVFNLKYDGEKASFKPLQELKQHNTCILKTLSFQHKNKTLLVTCTTRGNATFWDINADVENLEFKPFFSTNLHQSGINSVVIKSDENVLICTGGDDNSINLNLIEINEDLDAKLIHTWSSDKFHCSQVTGLACVDNLIISASIDQRVTVLKWEVNSTGIDCQFVSQVFSDVADVQGLDVVEYDSNSVNVCVFGKGMEVISVPRPAPL